MTPLRQRMIEDMCIRNFAGTTQRSYIHYLAAFAKYCNRSPQDLDLEAVRQYQLHLSQERQLFPPSIHTFVSAALRHLTSGAVQTACRAAWQHSGLAQRVTPHRLRHASAYYTTFPTPFILKTIGLGRARFAAVYGPRGWLSPIAVRQVVISPSGRLSTEHTLPRA